MLKNVYNCCVLSLVGVEDGDKINKNSNSKQYLNKFKEESNKNKIDNEIIEKSSLNKNVLPSDSF